jgi:DNA repair photolyase
VRRPPGAVVGLPHLRPLRLGQVRMTPATGHPPAWAVLDERRRGTRFLSLPVRSVLNSPASTHMGFWSINPYVGCEFGCTYCYARDTHRYVVERAAVGRYGGKAVEPALSAAKGERSEDQTNQELELVALPPYRPTALPPAVIDDISQLAPEDAFERRILIKTEVADVLARTLNPARLADHSLVIGTATDPYQPAERRFRLTRQILEVLLRYRGLSIGLITKSPLITRDLTLLQQLGQRHEVSVNISLATLDARLARRLELRSPVPAARIRALRRLARGGVHAGLLIAPIVPGITDSREGLGRLMAAAKEAGARYVVGSALRLGPAARHRFLPHLVREFPELAARYQRHYGTSEQVSAAYQEALTRRLRRLQQEHGFPADEGMQRRQQLEGRAPRNPAIEEQPALL